MQEVLESLVMSHIIQLQSLNVSQSMMMQKFRLHLYSVLLDVRKKVLSIYLAV